MRSWAWGEKDGFISSISNALIITHAIISAGHLNFRPNDSIGIGWAEGPNF